LKFSSSSRGALTEFSNMQATSSENPYIVQLAELVPCASSSAASSSNTTPFAGALDSAQPPPTPSAVPADLILQKTRTAAPNPLRAQRCRVSQVRAPTTSSTSSVQSVAQSAHTPSLAPLTATVAGTAAACGGGGLGVQANDHQQLYGVDALDLSFHPPNATASLLDCSYLMLNDIPVHIAGDTQTSCYSKVSKV